jgi:hypothetical protein
MRRFVATSLLVSAVLLAAEVCFAQDKQPAAAGANAESQDMWAAYKKMWEGEWVTSFTMPMDVEGSLGIKKGDKFTGTTKIEVILGGNGLLITRVFRNAKDEVVVEGKALASWCPKQKVILLHELATLGGHTEGISKVVDGQEHNTSTLIDAEGKESVTHSVGTVINENANKVKSIDGALAGLEVTWKRKKG